MKPRNLRAINEIIVHINDSKYPQHDVSVINGPGWHQDRFNTPASMAPKGKYRYCGYHYIVKFDGTVQEGRRLEYYGQHCSGRNYNSIGICLQGSPETEITQDEFKSLKELVMDLKLKIPTIKKVKQHSDYDPSNKPFCAGLKPKQMNALVILVQ